MGGGSPKEDGQSGVRSYGRCPRHPEPAPRTQPCFLLAWGVLASGTSDPPPVKWGEPSPPLGPFTFSEMMQRLAGVGGGPAQTVPCLADGWQGLQEAGPWGRAAPCVTWAKANVQGAAAGAGRPPPSSCRTPGPPR